MKATVIICPGNGCNDIKQSNWYGHLFTKLQDSKMPCVCEDFPDPLHARRDRWIPFIRSKATQDKEEEGEFQNTILVGHSSGAQAALRYAELYPLKAVVLVSATYSDLGDAHERASGYYPQKKSDGSEDNKYEFEKMKLNCPSWFQLHADNDPFIPLHEAERIRDGLGLSNDQYFMLPGRSHFFDFDDQIWNVLQSIC